MCRLPRLRPVWPSARPPSGGVLCIVHTILMCVRWSAFVQATPASTVCSRRLWPLKWNISFRGACGTPTWPGSSRGCARYVGVGGQIISTTMRGPVPFATGARAGVCHMARGARPPVSSIRGGIVGLTTSYLRLLLGIWSSLARRSLGLPRWDPMGLTSTAGAQRGRLYPAIWLS